MPQTITETDKTRDVEEIVFNSSTEAIIVTKDTKASNVILDLLHTLIRNSGFDGGKKLDFTIVSAKQSNNLYSTPHKALIVNGNLNQAVFSLFQAQCISDGTYQKLTNCISKLTDHLYDESKEGYKSKLNIIKPSSP